MAADNKDLLKRELIWCLRINQQINFDDLDEVKKYQRALEKKQPETTVGIRYIKRLGEIADGDVVTNGCILCGNSLNSDRVFCGKCKSKYRKAVPYETEPWKGPGLPRQDAESVDKSFEILSTRVERLPYIPEESEKHSIDIRKIIVSVCMAAASILAIALLAFGIWCVAVSMDKSELGNIIGKNQKSIERRYGKPDSVSGSSGFILNGYDEGDWYYVTDLYGNCVNVELYSEDKTLMGISVGMTADDVNEVMEKKGAKELFDENSDIYNYGRSFELKGIYIFVEVESGEVSSVMAYPLE